MILHQWINILHQGFSKKFKITKKKVSISWISILNNSTLCKLTTPKWGAAPPLGGPPREGSSRDLNIFFQELSSNFTSCKTTRRTS